MPVVRVNTGFQATMGQSVAKRPVTIRQYWYGTVYAFVFPFAPTEVTFDDLSADVVELENPLNYPNLSIKGFRPTKLNFTVTIAERSSSGLIPVDDQLRALRSMALRDSPVTFTGMDRLLQYQSETYAANLVQAQWRINSLSVRVKRRVNSNATDGVGNQISQAEVTMGFIEQRNKWEPAYYLPKIFYPVEFPVFSGGGGGGGGGSIGGVGTSPDGYGSYTAQLPPPPGP